MTHTFCIESNSFVLDLHAFLQSIDPARWRQDVEVATRERLNSICAKLNRILESHDAPVGDRRMTRLYEELQNLARQIEDLKPRAGNPAARLREEWRLFQRRLQPAYGSIAASLERLAVPVPSLRPTNYFRNVFHISTGLFTLFLIQYLLLSTASMMITAASVAAFCWLMEALRVRYDGVTRFFMLFLGKIAHPHEHHRVNSSTWFVTALLVLALLASPTAASLGVIVLAVADPLAAMVGRRFGRTFLRYGRTVEGSLAFVVVGTLAGLAVLLIYYPELGWGTALLAAVAASTFGALTELYSSKLDDNFTIPLGAALGATIVLTVLG